MAWIDGEYIRFDSAQERELFKRGMQQAAGEILEMLSGRMHWPCVDYKNALDWIEHEYVPNIERDKP